MSSAPSRAEPTLDDRPAGLDGLFEAAADRCGTSTFCARIAGAGIRLTFAGTDLRDRIAGAFAHLEIDDPGDDALEVQLWDSASSSTPAPPTFGGRVSDDATGPVFYSEADGVQAISRWHTLSVYDAGANRAWFWAPSVDALLSWDWASPIRSLLHWWLGRRGILQVHGGAVGLPDGGVLVVGRGGSGKSTTTLSALTPPLRYAGDDFVAVEPGPTPWIHSLYSTGKLETHHLARFPALEPAVVNPERLPREKAVVQVHRTQPERTIAGFPLRAVVVPRIVPDGATRLVPATPAAALAALAPSTIFQLHPPQRDALKTMAAIVSTTPCYSLELGGELERIPSVLTEFLA